MPPAPDSPTRPSQSYDVIVVGAGVVGCAVARRLALEGARVLVAEKAADILNGASKGNSAILHTGFDAPPGSIEQACIADGYREFLDIHQRLNLPLLKSGALVLAWNEEQETRLDQIVAAAHANQVTDVERIDAAEARQMEPALADNLVAAVRVPGESLVDPWSTPLAYLLQAMAHGADFLNRCEVTGGIFDGESWQLQSGRGTLTGHWLINCAGLYGDLLHRQLLAETPFHILPRKGQFLVFDKSARKLSSTVLLPVPGETTKGIVVCPTVFGNLLVGPTAEEQVSRDNADVETDTLAYLRTVGEAILPGLSRHPITAVYAGLRPATQSKEYRIQMDPSRRYLCLGGIRSTGLSAALGIARLAFRKITGAGEKYRKPDTILWPKVAQISECGQRDWERSGNHGIVCHCELVTRREILQALQGPLPAQTLAGLKRRTRATMGRCQGFYCSAELSEITLGYLSPAISAPLRASSA
jgi:glycerol-3-phosphate dehydrogenase